jgi:hypothetical protein
LVDQTQTAQVETTADHLAEYLLASAMTTSPAEIFDAASTSADEATRLRLAKSGADLLVKSRLARFADDGRTTIELTNAGRYWALHGGWMTFLKEPPQDGGGRGRNPETEALRTEFMKLRLRTFWWTFGLSVAGFVISIVSMAVAIMYGNRLVN